MIICEKIFPSLYKETQGMQHLDYRVSIKYATEEIYATGMPQEQCIRHSKYTAIKTEIFMFYLLD